MVVWLVGWLVGWLIGWLIGWLNGSLASWLAGTFAWEPALDHFRFFRRDLSRGSSGLGDLGEIWLGELGSGSLGEIQLEPPNSILGEPSWAASFAWSLVELGRSSSR